MAVLFYGVYDSALDQPCQARYGDGHPFSVADGRGLIRHANHLDRPQSLFDKSVREVRRTGEIVGNCS